MNKSVFLRWFEDLSLNDLPTVGGKNASLGELIGNLRPLGVTVPNGFALTVAAYKDYLSHNNLYDFVTDQLSKINIEDLTSLQKSAKKIREKIKTAEFPSYMQDEVVSAYNDLRNKCGADITVAVRSSATAEDLPDASFAGQQDTLLNISGEESLIEAIKQIYSSLYTDRAISYRHHHNFGEDDIGLSVGIQMMVRSDLASSGVMFSIDTETGFDKVVFITASYGLGELIVQGGVNPDEYYVEKRALLENQSAVISKSLGTKLDKIIYNDKPTNVHDMIVKVPVAKNEQSQFVLTESEIVQLSSQALSIEQHYKRPMDIEWAKDGVTGKIYIVQARPETVTSNKNKCALEKYILTEKSERIVVGRSVGQKIGAGNARVVSSLDEIHTITKDDVLVTDMTDPDWEPVMKKVAAIVTNRGGRTCHAAIIARELGIPAIVGCGDATDKIANGQPITISCAEGEEGIVYDGTLSYDLIRQNVEEMPHIDVNIMMNVGNPTQAFSLANIPSAGVGLARLEFVINHMIGIHPRACLDYPKLPADLKTQIEKKTSGYASPREFYVSKLAEGMAMLAVAFWPKPVIVRLSDFKSNEYSNLLGGKLYEPIEENPMIGFRGASRYVSEEFKESFKLECEAVNRVRLEHGLSNIQVMVPFVRTVDEAKKATEVMSNFGLTRGENGLKLIMMCEVPSNAILAKQFLEYFDGFSIGSNDLTQLTLGLDRDSGLVAGSFSEQDPAVIELIRHAINTCKQEGKYIGICGQGPSDKPEFAKWLIEQKIDSISLTPDSVLSTWFYIANNQEH